MTKLTDTQLVILSAAAGRDDRAVLPLPKSLKSNKGTTTKALKALIKKGLVEETAAAPGDEHWSEDTSGHKITLTITDAGLAALDGEPAKPTAKQASKRSENRRSGSDHQASKRSENRRSGSDRHASNRSGSRRSGSKHSARSSNRH